MPPSWRRLDRQYLSWLPRISNFETLAPIFMKLGMNDMPLKAVSKPSF
jgi:hypothetical protein